MLYYTFIGDKSVLVLARRNNGIHRPEHQLLASISPAIIDMAMIVLYVFTAGGGTKWWGPYINWAIFQYLFSSGYLDSLPTTFASEATTQYSCPVLVIVVDTKNIVLLDVSFGLTAMIEMHGYT
ncbi:hypothetical protein ACN47E_009003 [Coniothyrium glycines]